MCDLLYHISDSRIVLPLGTAAYLHGCFGFAVSLSPKRLSDNDKAGISGSIPSTQISLRSVRSQGPPGRFAAASSGP